MTIISIPLYGYINNNVKRFLNLAKIAKSRNLYFSNQDEVGSNVIALDARKRKLLYVKKLPGITSCLIIDVSNLYKCSVKKIYNSIHPGDLNRSKLQHFLKSISLNLYFKQSFNKGLDAVSLLLYDYKKELTVDDIHRIEVKAKKWETLVSSLSPLRISETAKL